MAEYTFSRENDNNIYKLSKDDFQSKLIYTVDTQHNRNAAVGSTTYTHTCILNLPAEKIYGRQITVYTVDSYNYEKPGHDGPKTLPYVVVLKIDNNKITVKQLIWQRYDQPTNTFTTYDQNSNTFTTNVPGTVQFYKSKHSGSMYLKVGEKWVAYGNLSATGIMQNVITPIPTQKIPIDSWIMEVSDKQTFGGDMPYTLRLPAVVKSNGYSAAGGSSSRRSAPAAWKATGDVVAVKGCARPKAVYRNAANGELRVRKTSYVKF
jgi:hypothetical protein